MTSGRPACREKAANVSTVIDHKAGLAKVNEERSRQHFTHASVTPPLANNGCDGRVVGWFYMANVNTWHCVTFAAYRAA